MLEQWLCATNCLGTFIYKDFLKYKVMIKHMHMCVLKHHEVFTYHYYSKEFHKKDRMSVDVMWGQEQDFLILPIGSEWLTDYHATMIKMPLHLEKV